MNWETAPFSERGRQQTDIVRNIRTSQRDRFLTNAVLTCLTMKMLFGIARRQIKLWKQR